MPGAGGQARRLLGELTGAVDALVGYGPLSGSRADTAALLALAERARALALRELAEMDAVGGHLDPTRTGRTSTTSWLMEQRRLKQDAAHATVRLAVELRDELPRLGAQLASGAVDVEHARAVLAGVRGLDRTLVRDTGDALCGLAATADPHTIRVSLRDKAHALDDRLAAQAARRAHDRRGLTVADVGAQTAVHGTLPAEQGALLRLALDLAVAADRRTASGTGTGTGTGDGGPPPDKSSDKETAGGLLDGRSRAARQADVLLGWARDYLARQHGPGDSLANDARTVRTHLLISATPEQLLAAPLPVWLQPAGTPGTTGTAAAGQPAVTLAGLLAADPTAVVSAGIIASDSPLSRGALRRLACDATISLLVRDPGRPDPLYVGRSARTVSGPQFTALVARDRRCVRKGCRRPASQCEAHHVEPWADGGPTDLGNLVLLCFQCHHDLHDRGHALPHHDGQRWLTQTGWAQAPP